MSFFACVKLAPELYYARIARKLRFSVHEFRRRSRTLRDFGGIHLGWNTQLICLREGRERCVLSKGEGASRLLVYVTVYAEIRGFVGR